jgi:hypothetical protein
LKHLKTFENIEIERIELAENIHTNASNKLADNPIELTVAANKYNL